MKITERRVNIQRVILGCVAAAGIVSLLILAPNAAGHILRLFAGRRRRYYLPAYVKATIGRLEQKGWITIAERRGKKFARLTEEGKRVLARYRLREMTIRKPRRWDGKWRLVIFDITEWKRITRHRLRAELINLGFVRLQNSVWVFPYECEEVLFLLKTSFGLGKEVLYIRAEKIEYDRWLRRRFGLPQM